MQSVIPNAKKAPQCLLVGFHRTSILVRVFVRKRKCRRGTTTRIEIDLEATILLSFLYLRKKGVVGGWVFLKKTYREGQGT